MVQRGERRRDHTRLIRYDPEGRPGGRTPFFLDSLRPRMKLAEYRRRELRFQALPAPTPARPSGCLASPSRPRTCAGSSTKRWRPGSRSLPCRCSEGQLMDLGTNYLGLRLRNPLVASASPRAPRPRRHPPAV